VEDNGAFTSLLVTTAIAGGIWLAMGIARGFVPVTTRALLWFAGAGVLTAYVGRVAFYATVERLGAMRAATLQRLNPFFAVVMGMAVLHESIAGRTGIGVGLILASFAVLVLAARGREGAPLARLGAMERMGYVTGIVSALGYSTGYLLRSGCVDVCDDGHSALAHHPLADRETNPAAAAGYDDDLSLKSHHRALRILFPKHGSVGAPAGWSSTAR